MVGAALAWAVVIVGLNVARVVQVRQTLGVSPFGRGLWKPLAAGVGAAGVGLAAVRFAPANGAPVIGLLAGASLFAVTYVVTFLALRPDPEDLMLLRTLRGGRRDTVAGDRTGALDDRAAALPAAARRRSPDGSCPR